MILIVFDCDGTLVDSQHLIVAAMERAFQYHGLAPPGRSNVLAVVGLSLNEAVGRLVPQARDIDILAIADTYKSSFAELRRDQAHREPLFPGIREALAKLAQERDVVMGVATGKSRRGLSNVLEREGLADYFITVQTADTHPSKPHPAMLLAAIAEAGATCDRTLMIGDTTYDMAMAREAGARALGAGWGYHQPTDLWAAGAHCVIEHSDRLAEVTMGTIAHLRSA